MPLRIKIFVIAILNIGFQLIHAQDTLVISKKGHISENEIFKLVYVPIEIPDGYNRIHVEEVYNAGNASKKNTLNLGIYDPSGSEIGNPAGFRGWSGGAKTSFFIGNKTASNGYIAGPIYPGTWQILIYPSDISNPGIDWTLTVKAIKGEETVFFKPNPAQRTINTTPGWYVGDMHMHTLHSDGKRTAKELVDEAILKELDFIISTEHNTNSANLQWGDLDNDNLLIINGLEVTSTEYGHWNAIGLKAKSYIDWRYSPEEVWINKMIEKVHQDNGLAIINHPFYSKEMKNTFKYDYKLCDGVEVWNGNWNILNNLAVEWWNEQLILGHKLIAIGGSDSHVKEGSRNNLGTPQTVVYAESLSKDDLIKSIKNGMVYIKAEKKTKLHFEAKSGNNKATIGETLTILKTKNSINMNINLENSKGNFLKIITNLGLFKEQKINLENTTLSFQIDKTNIKYLRIEVRDKDNNMKVLTNPIFISNKN